MSSCGFILYAGALGSSLLAMEPKTIAAGLYNLKQCHAVAAIGIDELNRKHPDKDFAAACGCSDTGMPVEPLSRMRLKDLIKRALEP